MSPLACSGRKGRLVTDLVLRLNGAGTPQRAVPTSLIRYRMEEGRGEEKLCVRMPLSSVLSPLLRHGERKKECAEENLCGL